MALSTSVKINDLLNKVKQWATTNNYKLVLGDPLSDAEIDSIPIKIVPHFGTVVFRVPPSFRQFLKIASSAKVVPEEDGGAQPVTPFHIYSVDEIVSINKDKVHVAANVSYDKGNITTNHFVGFAEADSNAIWCFNTESTDGSGEASIYGFDQDDPVNAKYVDNGKWVDEESADPEYANFLEWLDAYVKNICGERDTGDVEEEEEEEEPADKGDSDEDYEAGQPEDSDEDYDEGDDDDDDDDHEEEDSEESSGEYHSKKKRRPTRAKASARTTRSSAKGGQQKKRKTRRNDDD